MTTDNTAAHPAPTGAQELPPPPTHPEPRTYTWSGLELAAIKAYGRQCMAAGAAQAIAAQAGQEPRAWANGDELDNMLDDRTATVTGVPSGWRKTPLYAHPAAPAPAAAAPEWRTIADALRPFADIGAWLHARPLPDDTPMVDLHGLNGQAGALTRGHFKKAHTALQALEFATPPPPAAGSDADEYDRGCGETLAAVLAILDGEDTGEGVMAHDPAERVRRRLLALCRPAAGSGAEALTALRRLGPYLDAIACYASTQGEHEPNQIVAAARAVIAQQAAAGQTEGGEHAE